MVPGVGASVSSISPCCLWFHNCSFLFHSLRTNWEDNKCMLTQKIASTWGILAHAFTGCSQGMPGLVCCVCSQDHSAHLFKIIPMKRKCLEKPMCTSPGHSAAILGRITNLSDQFTTLPSQLACLVAQTSSLGAHLLYFAFLHSFIILHRRSAKWITYFFPPHFLTCITQMLKLCLLGSFVQDILIILSACLQNVPIFNIYVLHKSPAKRSYLFLWNKWCNRW